MRPPDPEIASRPPAPPGGVPRGGDRPLAAASAARRAALTRPSVARATPDAVRIARRRRLVRWSKRLLPLGALALLGSIALWPEIGRLKRVGGEAIREATELRAANGIMTQARYRGIDKDGRPYTVTARSAHQVAPDRVDLVAPVADMLQSGGRWILVSADRGVYAPHEEELDLQGHVWLYRDDGTMMWAPTSTLDVRKDVDASRDWVHIEGPFGVLDAPSYFMSGHDGVGQFAGPARLVLNQARHDAGPTAAASQATGDNGSAPR